MVKMVVVPMFPVATLVKAPHKWVPSRSPSTDHLTMPIPHRSPPEEANSLLQLLLRAKLVGVATLLLAAVGGTRRQARVALPADHLVAVVLGRESLERGLDDAAAETEDEVESGFLMGGCQRSQLFSRTFPPKKSGSLSNHPTVSS